VRLVHRDQRQVSHRFVCGIELGIRFTLYINGLLNSSMKQLNPTGINRIDGKTSIRQTIVSQSVQAIPGHRDFIVGLIGFDPFVSKLPPTNNPAKSKNRKNEEPPHLKNKTTRTYKATGKSNQNQL